MRALYLSLFLMTFFLTFSLFTGFAEFGGFAIDSSGLTDANYDNTTIALSQDGVTDELTNLKDESFNKLNTIKTDNTILSILAVAWYGIQLIFMVILNTIRYLLFFADVLLMWGTPLVIASFIQLMIYVSYLITLLEISGVKK